MCDQFESEYQDAEAARESELALLTALRAMVEEKLRNRVHGHGETRGDQSAEEWQSHDTGYQYDNGNFNEQSA